jgi:hypothetical protein
MYWFKWLQFFNIEKDIVKTKHLLVQSHISQSDTKLNDFIRWKFDYDSKYDVIIINNCV